MPHWGTMSNYYNGKILQRHFMSMITSHSFIHRLKFMPLALALGIRSYDNTMLTVAKEKGLLNLKLIGMFQFLKFVLHKHSLHNSHYLAEREAGTVGHEVQRIHMEHKNRGRKKNNTCSQCIVKHFPQASSNTENPCHHFCFKRTFCYVLLYSCCSSLCHQNTPNLI